MSASQRVEIVDYDGRWPALFAAERAALRGLGACPLIDIEHFGSTAVPGLRAKPIVDIMASVARLEDADAFAPQLASIDYRPVDGAFRRRRFFAKALDDGDAGFHLHLVPAEAWADKHERLFRDWLIAHPGTAEAYGRLKTALAARFATDREAYTEAKSAFVCAAVNEARGALGLAPVTDCWEE